MSKEVAKATEEDRKRVLTPELYGHYKREQELLTALFDYMPRVKEFPASRSFIGRKFVNRELTLTFNTLFAHLSMINEKLKPLQEEKFSSKSGRFEFVSEDELRKSRSKAYDYVL